MDNGLLITLICNIGGGFVIILNEINKEVIVWIKKNWVVITFIWILAIILLQTLL